MLLLNGFAQLLKEKMLSPRDESRENAVEMQVSDCGSRVELATKLVKEWISELNQAELDELRSFALECLKTLEFSNFETRDRRMQ